MVIRTRAASDNYKAFEKESKNAVLMREFGLSICPDSILFLDSFVGKTYKSKITFRNICAKKIILLIGKPYNECFEMNESEEPFLLAPGLFTVREITFNCVHNRTTDSALPVWVDNVSFEISIRVKIAEPHLIVSPTRLSYGVINFGGRYVSKYLQLINTGADESSFSIDLGTNPLDLVASPKMGTLNPYSYTAIRLDLAAYTPGDHLTQFWVKGSPSTLVYVEVTVLLPFFQAIHPNTTNRFTLVNFKDTYYETIRCETLLVRNMSSSPATFVVLAEIENNVMPIEEVGSVDPDKAKHYKNFSVEPMEGSLGPFESRIFTVWFHPQYEIPSKGWMQSQLNEDEYLCFLRVFKVDIREWMSNSTQAAKKKDDEDSDSLNLRLCLHGCAQKPSVGVLTSLFVFDEVCPGQRVTRVVHLKNQGVPPVFCRFVKATGFEVKPREKMIPGGKSTELTMTFSPTSLGIVEKYIVFDILSYENMTMKKEKIVIGQLKIPVKCRIKATTVYPKPQFNLGITPKLANEVGEHIDGLRFCDSISKPVMVMLPPSKDKAKPWLRSDARIAFPNDMPKTLRIKPYDKSTTTIFTGKERYVPPINTEYAYTQSEHQQIRAHQNIYRKFIDEKYQEKLRSILKHEPKYWTVSPSEMRWYKRVDRESLLESSKKALKKCPVDINIKEIIPLSPKYLFNVRIMPKNLDFGQIPVDVDCERKVLIENMNSFPVLIQMHMQNDSTGTNDDWFIVGPQKRQLKHVTLNVPNFGRYYRNISFVINNSDCFDMIVMADVVRRYLSVVPHDIVISNKVDDIFQMSWCPVRLVNSLYVPTSFTWKVPAGCPYLIEPMSGTVPGQRNICCAIYFDANVDVPTTSINLQVEDGISSEVKITKCKDKTHNVVAVFQKKILSSLSCNLLHRDEILLFNAGFREANFSVLNPFPFEGVSVAPIAGIISGKSVFNIEIEFDMDRIQAFEATFIIRIQAKSNIEVKFIGFVFFPRVEFTPKKLELRNIPLYSMSTYTFKAENCGQCPVILQFEMSDEFAQIQFSEEKKFSLPYIKQSDEFFLQPGGFKEFYIHFNPQNFATYELLLPAFFNKKIGPPRLYNDVSQDPLTYVKSAELVNKIFRYIDLSYPPKLTTCNIDVSVGRGHIYIQSWSLSFFVPEKNCSQRKFLYLKNLTGQISTIFMEPKLFSKNYSFSIRNMPKDGTYNLQPHEEIALQVVFCPKSYENRIHDLEVPVIVKDYSTTSPYNYLRFSGELRKGTLSASVNLIQILPVPVGVLVEKLITVTAMYQEKSTKLSTCVKTFLGLSEDLVIDFAYPSGNSIPAGHLSKRKKTVIPLLVKFKSTKMISQQGTFQITDDLDGKCDVQFTFTADNSIMTCYSYLIIHKCLKKNWSSIRNQLHTEEGYEETTGYKIGDITDSDLNQDVLEEILDFPKCPPPMSETYYAYKLRRIVSTTENWLYEQGFCGSFKMNIGEHFAFSKSFITGQGGRSKKTQQDFVKSIIDLLFMFVGRDLFLEYQFPSLVPPENSERINYALSIYRQVLKFITVQGGCVAHVFPVYMLSYEDYCDHFKTLKSSLAERKKKGMSYEELFEEICSKSTFLEEEDFLRYNKQAWLDVFLQIHRTVVQSGTAFSPELLRCMNLSDSANASFITSRDISYCSYSVEAAENKAYRILERGDKVLIEWLNVVYNNAKARHGDLNFPDRYVSDIVDDLEDAVVLSVVIMYYCPYLIEDFFNDFFFEPTDANQIHHNASQVSLALAAIRIGITVKPEDFFHVNPAALVIIVTHLYQVLRSYIPDRTIEFLACLTTSVTRKVTLTNPNDSLIGYSIKILGNESKVFNIETSRSSIMIPPKSSTKISITFSAKKLIPVEATLLLCGTYMPNGYVQNIVLKLHGNPYRLMVSREFTVLTPIMKPTFTIAKVDSPYDTEAEYDIWYADEEPKSGLLNVRPWSEVKQLQLPRSIFLNCDRIVIPPAGRGIAPLSITAACFTRSVLQFWIVFKNDAVGDFIARVVLKPRVESPSLILKVPLPSGLCTGYPGTICSPRCPRLQFVNIPSRNGRLWNTVKTMLLLTVNKTGLSFWEDHFETRIGLDLMKWLLGKAAKTIAKEISFIFELKVKYKVTSLSPYVQVQECLEIEDIHSREFVPLSVHLCCQINSEFWAEILLESESGQEVRLYRVRFSGGGDPKQVCLRECMKGCPKDKP